MHGLCKLTETEVKLERNLQVNKPRSLELDLGNLGLEMPQVSQLWFYLLLDIILLPYLQEKKGGGKKVQEQI